MAHYEASRRFFNNVVYELLAPVYDSLDWLTLGAWWRYVRRALAYIPAHQRALEVGFGPGKLHTALARRADLCVGLDLAMGMCRFTRRRLSRAGLPARLVRGSAFRLPFPSESFDVVVSTFAISCLPDADQAIAEMARALAPGGRLVLVDIGLPRDGNRAGTFWAHLWERFGDFLYDYPALMRANALDVIVFDEFGPGKHLRVIVGHKA
ncbi:MAG: methyltransferase domain-containing protein [Anaerolineae bacterium]|nr:methyltransferase domain-containing protein [Anaerolineae bacterium]